MNGNKSVAVTRKATAQKQSVMGRLGSSGYYRVVPEKSAASTSKQASSTTKAK